MSDATDTKDDKMPAEIRAVFGQGNRMEDGIPCDLNTPEGVAKDAGLCWMDLSTCECGQVGEGRTVVDIKLLELMPPTSRESYISGERAKVRARFPEMGPCPSCGKKFKVRNG